MSIDKLPNEVLVKIFSYFRWKTLRDRLSLVNRRWYQVIGMPPLSNKATLTLSKSIWHRQLESKPYEDICIPLDVLWNSSRGYKNFSCSMHSMDYRMMSGAFAAVLDYCHQRWNMRGLRITSRYGQFILFLQQHRLILDGVIEAHITVREFPPEEGCFEGEALPDTNFLFPMAKVEKLTFEFEPWYKNFQAPLCSLSLHTPNLEFLTIRRCVIRNNVYMTFYGCAKLREVMIFSRKPLHNWSVPDPVELDSILLQASEIARLQLVNCRMAKNFSTIFGNLKTLVLAHVSIVPTDDAVKCVNLTKLVLRSIIFRKPLKIRTPQLRTLICDCGALKALQLEDAFKAEQLVIDWAMPYSTLHSAETASHLGLSSFPRLLLKPWLCINSNDDVAIRWLFPCLSGISELKLLGNFKEDHFNVLKDLWQNCPRIVSLSLEGVTVPETLNFVPVSVQNVFIKDCSTEGNSIEFPPSVTCVQVQKLWKQTQTEDDGMCLLPLNRYAALESYRKKPSRIVYSTRRGGPLDN